jgi:DNA-binding transcriptional ArsR family regulator
MNEKTKRKTPERRPAGIKAMSAPAYRPLPEDHPSRSMFKQAPEDETPTTPTTTTTATTPPIAPARDFQRVPNSITRTAVPSGMFTGKGKQVYDYLYSITRGAVTPSRSVRIPMDELAARSGIGSDRTLRKHLRRLADVGLVRVNEIGGTQGGNEFLVFIPEELTPTTDTTPTTPYHPYHHSPEVPVVPVVESESGTGGLSADFQRASDTPKTSSKTNTKDDDDVMPLLRARAGKPMPKTEAVLLSLLDTLEARTGGDISSHDALLAHVLRQKLAPRSNTAQRRPSEGQFRDRPVEIEVTDEDLAEYERNRAELAGD